MVIGYCDSLFVSDQPAKFLNFIPVNEVAGSPTVITWQELNQPIHLAYAKVVLNKIQRGQVFLGNITGISYEVEAFGRLFTYQATSYYDQLNNETIATSFGSTKEGVIELKGSLDDVIDSALDSSGAGVFVGPPVFRIDTQVETNANSPNLGAMVLGEKLYVELLADNLYMKDFLDAVATQLKLAWHVRAKDGRLIIYQSLVTNTSLPLAPFDIDLSLPCPAGGQILSPLKLFPTPPRISKTVVHGVRSLGRRAPTFEEVFRRTKEDIPADSVRKEYPILEETTEVIRVNIEAATPVVSPCNVEAVISGSNYLTNNTLYEPNFKLPDVASSTTSYKNTSTITGVKASSSVSFYIGDRTVYTTQGTLSVKVNGVTTIYSEVLTSDFENTRTVVSLAAYEGETIVVENELTLEAQDEEGDVTKYEGALVVDCCAIDTIVGTGNASGTGDWPLDEGHYAPDGIAAGNPTCMRKHSSGDLYYYDAANRILRKIDKTTLAVTRVGGSGLAVTRPISGGSALDQDFNQANDFCIYGDNLYIALTNWLIIGHIDLNTLIYTELDTFTGTFARLSGITCDNMGNIYYSGHNHDTSSSKDHVVYRRTPAGVKTIYAGIIGDAGFSGDTGLATSAQLSNPFGLACDGENNIYILDNDNSRVRVVTASDGKIDTIAGLGESLNFDTSAKEFDLAQDNLRAITVNKTTKDIYISTNEIVYKVNGSDNIISRFAGITDFGDINIDVNLGSPLTTAFSFIGFFQNFGGLEFIAEDEFYIVSQDAHRIHKIYCGQGFCHYSIIDENSLFEPEGGSGSFGIVTGEGCEWTIEVDVDWVTFTSAVSGDGSITVTFDVDANPGEFTRYANFILRTSGGAIATIADITQSGTFGGGI